MQIKMQSQTLLLILLTFALTGCLSVERPSGRFTPAKFVEEKNYQLNTPRTINVGDPVIVRKSYTYQEYEMNDRVEASNDFEVKTTLGLGGSFIRRGIKGEQLAVVG